MKKLKKRRLGGDANVVFLRRGGIADLQLTEGAQSDRLEVWRHRIGCVSVEDF